MLFALTTLILKLASGTVTCGDVKDVYSGGACCGSSRNQTFVSDHCSSRNLTEQSFAFGHYNNLPAGNTEMAFYEQAVRATLLRSATPADEQAFIDNGVDTSNVAAMTEDIMKRDTEAFKSAWGLNDVMPTDRTTGPFWQKKVLIIGGSTSIGFASIKLYTELTGNSSYVTVWSRTRERYRLSAKTATYGRNFVLNTTVEYQGWAGERVDRDIPAGGTTSPLTQPCESIPHWADLSDDVKEQLRYGETCMRHFEYDPQYYGHTCEAGEEAACDAMYTDVDDRFRYVDVRDRAAVKQAMHDYIDANGWPDFVFVFPGVLPKNTLSCEETYDNSPSMMVDYTTKPVNATGMSFIRFNNSLCTNRQRSPAQIIADSPNSFSPIQFENPTLTIETGYKNVMNGLISKDGERAKQVHVLRLGTLWKYALKSYAQAFMSGPCSWVSGEGAMCMGEGYSPKHLGAHFGAEFEMHQLAIAGYNVTQLDTGIAYGQFSILPQIAQLLMSDPVRPKRIPVAYEAGPTGSAIERTQGAFVLDAFMKWYAPSVFWGYGFHTYTPDFLAAMAAKAINLAPGTVSTTPVPNGRMAFGLYAPAVAENQVYTWGFDTELSFTSDVVTGREGTKFQHDITRRLYGATMPADVTVLGSYSS